MDAKSAIEMIEPEALIRRIGEEIGVSPWMVIDQDRINEFAEITEDRQFIHIDPIAAETSPFGGTIAHGFLTVSMLSVMCEVALPVLKNMTMSVNYGFDRLRFVHPVRARSRIRGKFVLSAVKARDAQQAQFTYQTTVEIENVGKPALIADWLFLMHFDRPIDFSGA